MIAGSTVPSYCLWCLVENLIHGNCYTGIWSGDFSTPPEREVGAVGLQASPKRVLIPPSHLATSPNLFFSTSTIFLLCYFTEYHSLHSHFLLVGNIVLLQTAARPVHAHTPLIEVSEVVQIRSPTGYMFTRLKVSHIPNSYYIQKHEARLLWTKLVCT